MADNFKERFSQAVKETETVVYSYLPEETGHQKTIFEAMNYSVKAGGKRLRPLLMRCRDDRSLWSCCCHYPYVR